MDIGHLPCSGAISSLADQDPLALIPEIALAARWNKSIRTLQRWRADGYGPAFVLIGGSVYYRVGDVIDFESRVRRGGKVAE